MKLLPAAVFVCVGVWLTYNYPEIAETLYAYILSFLDWASSLIGRLKGAN